MPQVTPLVLYVSFPFELTEPLYGQGQPYIADHAAKLAYVDALERELASFDDEMRARPVAAIRLGGGASYANADHVARFVQHLRSELNVVPRAEISIVADPLTVGTPTLTDWTACGINRVLLRVHSVHDRELTALGVPHTRQDVQNALQFLARFHMAHVDARLLFGLPEQTADSWNKTLLTIADMGVAHITALPLVDNRESNAADGETLQEMYRMASRVLEAQGYRQYALGRFVHTTAPHAIDQFDAAVRSGAEQIGMGAGATSWYGGFTWHNVEDFDAYVRDAGTFEKTTVAPQKTDEEFALTRRLQGALDEGNWFTPEEAAEKLLTDLVVCGTCERDPQGRVRYTEQGRQERLVALAREQLL